MPEQDSPTTERDSLTDGIERRGVLAAVATGLGGVGFARSSLARQIDAMDASRYVVEQDGRCVPITPLSGDETVESFYDYRTPDTSPSGDAYSSYGTTDLQRAETSICFLYDGPNGLSLVVVHDRLEDGTNGGAVTFRFDGLAGGSWVVGDDDYDASTNYDTWTETSDGWQVDWTWAEDRSDGGVFRPLGDDFAVTIDPAFNEDAELYGDYYEGAITDWQVLSGDRSDPERVSLALDRPLTIRAGGCDGSQTTTTTTRKTTTEETTSETETTTEEETTEDQQADRQSSGPISVEVTVEPGKVNPRSHGRLPVVVRSDESFDATTLAPGSVEFGPGDANPVERTGTDADGDGRRDLKFHFRMDATDIGWDTDRVRLTGETTNGREVVGDADVELVPSGGDGGDDEGEDEDREENRDEAEDEQRKESEQEQKEEKRERKEENKEEKREEKEEKRERKAEKKEAKRERKREKREEKEERRDEWADDDDESHGDDHGRGNGRERGRDHGDYEDDEDDN